jgi:hypothetical protein
LGDREDWASAAPEAQATIAGAATAWDNM